MRGKEPIDVFLTENKNTDADTRGCHTSSVNGNHNSVARAGDVNKRSGESHYQWVVCAER